MNLIKASTLARSLLLAGVAIPILSRTSRASSLHGSHASMVHQHAIAVELDYSFVRTAAQLKALVADSALEPVVPNGDFALSGVSYPFARPAVRDFVQWLAAEYHAAIGSPLVVTSLTRPTSQQPKNASPLSVHPAGMAVDLRLPASTGARDWLEHELLSLEQAGAIDVTREQHPRHLHVAVFPEQYAAYAAEHSPATPVPPRITDTPEPALVQPPSPTKAAGDAAEGISVAAIAGGSLGLLLLLALTLAALKRSARPS